MALIYDCTDNSNKFIKLIRIAAGSPACLCVLIGFLFNRFLTHYATAHGRRHTSRHNCFQFIHRDKTRRSKQYSIDLTFHRPLVFHTSTSHPHGTSTHIDFTFVSLSLHRQPRAAFANFPNNKFRLTSSRQYECVAIIFYIFIIYNRLF